LLLGSNKVIYIEDLEPHTADNVVFDEDKEQLLISSIKFGSEKDVVNAVKVVFSDSISTKASLKDYQLYFTEILASISKLARVFQMDLGEMSDLSSNLYAELFKFNTLNEIREWFESICIKLKAHISGKMQNKTKIMLDKAKDYIQHNYYDDTLSIQKLADYLHISACYLSMIFKKEANETFLKYLVNIRLEAAKEYLRNSALSTSDIAEKVGYPDINYFSFFFKKNIGISPREYRNKFVVKKEI
jgi:two-component system response regulator YesN